MPDERGLPTADEIQQLPRWAQVAFAVRCARRAQPFFLKHWPNAPQKYLTAIEQAIRVAEHAATSGESASYGASADAARASYAAKAAYAARAAADAADAAADAAYVYDATNAAYAARAAADAGTNIEHIQRDWQLILSLSQNENWTDNTPVPPSVFGPLELPETEPVSIEPAVIPQTLNLRLRLLATDPTLSADTIRKHIVAIYKALNAHFLEKYGTILTRDQYKRILVESGVRSPVR